MDQDCSPVSVVIPVYNRKAMLLEALDSVVSQTLKPCEIIIVDDGSTDGTAEAVGCWLEGRKEETCKKIRYLGLSHCGMPGAVRNRGVEAASGKFIGFLDSDDLWMPEKLALQYRVMMARPGVVISHTRELWLRNGSVVSQKSQRHRREGSVFEDSLRKCILGPSTVMIDREVFLESGGFREDLEIAEDYELWLRLTPVHEVAFIDTPLTVKRAGHGEQLSEKYGHIEYFRILALRGLVDSGFFSGRDLDESKKVLSEKCRIYALGCRKRDRLDEWTRYLELSGRYAAP